MPDFIKGWGQSIKVGVPLRTLARDLAVSYLPFNAIPNSNSYCNTHLNKKGCRRQLSLRSGWDLFGGAMAMAISRGGGMQEAYLSRLSKRDLFGGAMAIAISRGGGILLKGDL